MLSTVRLGLFAIFCLMASSPEWAWSQKWATDMFPTREHSFGTVAKNADVAYEFELKNLYQEEVVIRSVRSSCGCVTPSYTKQRLESLESGAIVVKFNTDKFVGNRSATVTVTFEKPFFAEVQLKAGGLIRGDVVLEPGKVDFGSLADVSAARQTFVVDYRGGMANWQVTDVTSTFPHIRVSLQETQRQRGRVVYSLGVRLLPEAGSGFHQTELVLLTNDPANREIPVSVTAKIVEPLQVTPSYFDLGDVQVGQQVTKHLLVRSTEACQIVAASGDTASVRPIVAAGAKTLHRIPVQFTAGPELGQLKATVTIQTDGGVRQTVPLQANIVPPRQ